MSAPTRAPWTYRPNPFPDDHTAFWIEAAPPVEETVDVVAVADVLVKAEDGEAEANARILANALDVLTWAEKVVEGMEKWDKSVRVHYPQYAWGDYAKLREAIAASRGRELK